MKNILAFSFLVIFLISCTSDYCGSKNEYLNSYKSFVADVEKNYKNFSDEDWKQSNKEFKMFRDSCYNKFESQLTNDEEDQVFDYTTRYLLIKVKNVFQTNLSDDKFKEYSKKINEMFTKDNSFDFSKLKDNENINKSLNDFEDGIDKFGEGMDKLGKAFEKFADDLNKSMENNK
ncbi:MAG: DUF6565 domain-containing protein [Saprospiraceae bacterium]